MTDANGGLLSKNFAIFTRKHNIHLFFNFIEHRLQHRCFPVNIVKFRKNQFWRTSPYACFWKDFRKWLIRTFFLKRRFQNHPDLVILQKYQSLSNQNSLYILNLTLYFELRFLIFIIIGYDRKAKFKKKSVNCKFKSLAMKNNNFDIYINE